MKKQICEDVTNAIIDILMDIVQIDISRKDVNQDTSIYRDLLFDSILFIEYIVRLEEYFEICIDDDLLNLEQFETVGSTAKYIVEKNFE